MQIHGLSRAVAAVAGTALVVGAASALAASIVGTPRADNLRGTAKSDKLYGLAGNDRLRGMAGADLLVGGPGNDVLAGGPGADVLNCGPGRDTATADPADRVTADCELVTGLPKPGISIGDAEAMEGNAGTTTLSFPVRLAKPSQLAVSLSFATKDGTAVAPADYAAASGTITFRRGETAKTVAVTVTGETEFEPDEMFTVELSSPVNGTIADASASGTIRNDDKQKPRAGHYAGTTSQGRSIAFDVAPDVGSLTGLVVRVDISCTEVPITLPDEVISFGGRFPITPDGGFSFSDTDTDSDGTVTVSLTGTLVAPGSASGTFRLDLGINTPGGVVHCSTGNVTWTAA